MVHLRALDRGNGLRRRYDDFENRERVLERLSQVTLAGGVIPQMGTDWSPVGQIYFYTLESTNPEYDVMNLKSLENWVVEKNSSPFPAWWTSTTSADPPANIRFAWIPTSWSITD